MTFKTIAPLLVMMVSIIGVARGESKQNVD